ncbi:MAG: hypothetical protein ACFB4J_01040 [Elainellaceae cyanobacterium]
MHDNKVRLSQDVIEKAQMIATEWGLKNARAAVEAVFRRYSDEYLYGRQSPGLGSAPLRPMAGSLPEFSGGPTSCEALDELEDLLAM